MSVRAHADSPASEPISARGALTLSGVLLLVGFVANGIQRMLLHPAGAEDDHEAIFTEYAASDVWVATHVAEFVLVLVAFAGLLVLSIALRREASYLALLAAAAIVASAAAWAVLQAVDGVALKRAVDAWVAASGPEEASRLADAEAVRWTEWGLGTVLQLVVLVFIVGLLVVARRSRKPGTVPST